MTGVQTCALPISNAPAIEGNPDYDSIPKFDLDLDYYYDNYQDVYDYWLSVQP